MDGDDGGRPVRLVLWDVDHTLLEGGPFGREVYRSAFELLTGRRPAEEPRTDGRTDLAIMADLLDRHGVPLDAAGAGREAVVRALVDGAARVSDQLVTGGRALPGAAECLAALAGTPGVVQSVLTGNVAGNARLKLAAFGLDGPLDLAVGGYGSDSTVRADLVPVARRRVRERYGVDVAPGATVLVGDTLRDVEAARDGGARVLAVATGAFPSAQLRAAGADAVLESLADPAAVLRELERLTAG